MLLGACLAEEPSEDPGEALGEAEAALKEQPTPGAAGIGDSLYPTLGNGGYDVEHYDLDRATRRRIRRRRSTAR